MQFLPCRDAVKSRRSPLVHFPLETDDFVTNWLSVKNEFQSFLSINIPLFKRGPTTLKIQAPDYQRFIFYPQNTFASARVRVWLHGNIMKPTQIHSLRSEWQEREESVRKWSTCRSRSLTEFNHKSSHSIANAPSPTHVSPRVTARKCNEALGYHHSDSFTAFRMTRKGRICEKMKYMWVEVFSWIQSQIWSFSC